jgi:HK97 family phage portal protein
MSSRRNVGADFQHTVTKASRGFVTDFTGPGGYLTPNEIRLTDVQAMQFWKYNPWVNSTVDRIVADITKIQPVIRPRDNQVPTNRQKRRIKRVRTLLDNPNDNDESFGDIREKVLRDLLIIGRGSMEKVFDDDGNGDLSELYALVTRNIKIRSDEKGNIPLIDAYKQERRMTSTGFQDGVARGKDGPIYFDRDEVIYMVYKPVSWTLYGHKPLDTLANTVASDILRAQYNSVFFTNNGEASGILSAEGMSKTELKKLKQYFQARHKGASNAHRMLAMNVPVKFVQMAVTNRDMQFQEYGTELRQKIFAVYGMQPLIMGVLDSSTGRLNSEQQTQAYKDGALKPILRKESYYYTQHICWEGFGFTDLEIVFPDIDLQDAKTQSELDSKDTQAAILTINEVRGRRNLPPVPWGDRPVITLPGGGQIDEQGNLIAPSNQDGSQGGKKPEKKPEKKPAKEEKGLVSYFKDMREWCIINYPDHDYKEFRELFTKKEFNDIDEKLVASSVLLEVVNILTQKKYGSLVQLHSEIDSVFNIADETISHLTQNR